METEIKLTEIDFKKLTNILKKEATFLQESKQIDTYYQPTYRHFIDQEVINEWLRIGKRGYSYYLLEKNKVK